MRSDGGAPGTSSRSLADRAVTSPSQARRRAVCSSERRAFGAPALSSVTSASRSPWSVIAALSVLEQRRVQEAGERRDLPEHRQERLVERRAARERRRKFGAG